MSDKGKIFLGADHGGYRLKEQLREWLRSGGYEVVDVGAREFDPDDDYPQYAMSVAEAVRESHLEQSDTDGTKRGVGVLVCRMGGGMAMVANRFRGVRAVVCRDTEEAQKARQDNDANVVVLEGDRVNVEEAKAILNTFLTTAFGQGRHERRLRQFAHLGQG